jgi:hypothetical protein
MQNHGKWRSNAPNSLRSLDQQLPQQRLTAIVRVLNEHALHDAEDWQQRNVESSIATVWTLQSPPPTDTRIP